MSLLPAARAPAERQDANDWPVLVEVVNVQKLSDAARETLRSARMLDYAHADPASGDQAKAIAAYERYLELAPKDDVSLILNPMCRICYLYANTYVPEKGETYDFEKAGEWCRRALKLAEDNGIVSVEITDLRKLYMTSTLDRLERARRIAETHDWCKAVSQEDIDRNFPKCDKYARYIGPNPGLRPSFPSKAKRKFERIVASVRERCIHKATETAACAETTAVIRILRNAFPEDEASPELSRHLRDRWAQVFDEEIDIDAVTDLPVTPQGAGAPTRVSEGANLDIKERPRPGKRRNRIGRAPMITGKLVAAAAALALLAGLALALTWRRSRRKRRLKRASSPTPRSAD